MNSDMHGLISKLLILIHVPSMCSYVEMKSEQQSSLFKRSESYGIFDTFANMSPLFFCYLIKDHQHAGESKCGCWVHGGFVACP